MAEYKPVASGYPLHPFIKVGARHYCLDNLLHVYKNNTDHTPAEDSWALQETLTETFTQNPGDCGAADEANGRLYYCMMGGSGLDKLTCHVNTFNCNTDTASGWIQVNSGDGRINPLPAITVQKGGTDAGRVFAMWTVDDVKDMGSAYDHGYFAWSDDFGATWSARVKFDDLADTTNLIERALFIADNNGRLYIVYVGQSVGPFFRTWTEAGGLTTSQATPALWPTDGDFINVYNANRGLICVGDQQNTRFGYFATGASPTLISDDAPWGAGELLAGMVFDADDVLWALTYNTGTQEVTLWNEDGTGAAPGTWSAVTTPQGYLGSPVYQMQTDQANTPVIWVEEPDAGNGLAARRIHYKSGEVNQASWDYYQVAPPGPDNTQTLSASAGATATLSTTFTKGQSLVVAASATATLSTKVSRKRSLAASAGATALLATQTDHIKALGVTAGATAELSTQVTHRRTLSASAGATAALVTSRVTSQSLAASAGATAVLSTKFSKGQSLSATAGALATLSTQTSRQRSLGATAIATATIDPVTSRLRSYSVTAGATASIATQVARLRSLAASAGATATLATKAARKRSLGVTAGATATLGTVFTAGDTTTPQTLDATAGATAELSTQVSRALGLAVTVGATAALSTQVARKRTLSASAGATATLQATSAAQQALVVTAGATATLSTITSRSRTLSASAGALATLSALTTRLRTVTASAGATAELSTQVARKRSLGATAGATATLGTVFTAGTSSTPQALDATAGATAELSTQVARKRSLAASAGAIAALERQASLSEALGVTAGATATINARVHYQRTLSATAGATASLGIVRITDGIVLTVTAGAIAELTANVNRATRTLTRTSRGSGRGKPRGQQR